jgi:hypothetical protein
LASAARVDTEDDAQVDPDRIQALAETPRACPRLRYGLIHPLANRSIAT